MGRVIQLSIAFILLISFTGKAQLVRESGAYTYHRVVRLHGVKSGLYQKAKDWIDANNADGKYEIQYSNEEKGRIMVKGELEHHGKDGLSNIEYVFSVEFRNGMYRESFKDFKYVLLNGIEKHFEDKKLKSKAKIVKETDMKIAGISDDFKSYMTSEITASEK